MPGNTPLAKVLACPYEGPSSPSDRGGQHVGGVVVVMEDFGHETACGATPLPASPEKVLGIVGCSSAPDSQPFRTPAGLLPGGRPVQGSPVASQTLI